MSKIRIKAFINNHDDQLLCKTNKITANLDIPVQMETKANHNDLIRQTGLDPDFEVVWRLLGT